MSLLRKITGMSLSAQVIAGLVLGIASGLFFGERIAGVQPLGSIFIGLLQMTVIPYIVVSLIAAMVFLGGWQAPFPFLEFIQHGVESVDEGADLVVGAVDVAPGVVVLDPHADSAVGPDHGGEPAGGGVLVLGVDIGPQDGDGVQFVAPDAPVDELLLALLQVEVPALVIAGQGQGEGPLVRADGEHGLAVAQHDRGAHARQGPLARGHGVGLGLLDHFDVDAGLAVDGGFLAQLV